MSKETGGAAFPQYFNDSLPGIGVKKFDGMTLRDYFAAKAPAYALDIDGWSAKECAAFLGIKTYTYPDHYRLVLSKLAYEWADAMLTERAK